MQDTDIAVFAGRFRPFHKGHLHVVNEALNRSQYLFILVGSVGSPINPRNPFTFAEVREMIRGSLHPRDADRVFIFGIEDHDNDAKWVAQVQETVRQASIDMRLPAEPLIKLIGYEKDGSSYYLKLFPQWGSIGVGPHDTLCATTLREELFEGSDPVESVERWRNENILPHGSYLLLREWVVSPEFNRMRVEHKFMKDYLAQFSQKPYPRNFTTADAVVFLSGHVLLVRRGEMPGHGLWALPGGHIRDDETFRQAAIRELCEETLLGDSVDPELLPALERGEKLLDNPYRSNRKRTVSVAYLFDLTRLGLTGLPQVRGSDDAAAARWWPLNEITRDMMFEDHFMVIEHFKSQIEA